MKNKLHILSMALLGLYSLVLLHNVVPHFHFDDLSIKAEHVAETHGHHNGAENHHNQESNSDWLDLLMSLFGDTSHENLGSDHFDNYIAQNNVKVDAVPTLTLTAIAYVLLYDSLPKMDEVKLTTDPPPLLYKSSFPSSDPLRGPPSVA